MAILKLFFWTQNQLSMGFSMKVAVSNYYCFQFIVQYLCLKFWASIIGQLHQSLTQTFKQMSQRMNILHKSHKMKTNKQNFMQFPPFLYALKLSFRQGTQVTNVPDNSITQLTFISKLNPLNLVLNFSCRFSVSLSYYGISFSIPDLSGDRYLNFMIGKNTFYIKVQIFWEGENMFKKLPILDLTNNNFCLILTYLGTKIITEGASKLTQFQIGAGILVWQI